MLRLARYLKGFKKQVILGPVFKLIEAIFELIVPLVMAKIIDVGVKNSDMGYVLRMGGVIVLLGVAGLGCSLTCQYYASRASQGFGTVVRSELFRHINTLSHGELDQIGTPSLITRMTNDVNQLQYAVAMLIRLVVRAPFLVIGSVVMAMLLDLPLSLVFLVAAPLIALALYLVMSRSIPHYRVIQGFLDRVALVTRENLTGVRVIRAFSRQRAEEKRFGGAMEDLTRTQISVSRLSALLSPINMVILNLAVVAILWFGGIRVEVGRMTQGEVIAFINYLSQILVAMVVVANLVVTFTKASASADRVNQVFDLAPTVRDGPGVPREPQPAAGTPRVEFRDVSFSYPGSGEEALSGLTFRVGPGQTVGIIGGTGSGKSTLVNLIPRFYDVTAGEILVDGVRLGDYPLAELRGRMGLAPQKATLFTGTLRSNLEWGKKNASQAELQKALEIAQATEFVEKLEKGLDTPILQGGKNLSGGQKQRLTIARALVGSPDILILDDSASALDFATDAALRRSLRKETAGMTVFMVSQRANTVRAADWIIVLDDGHIAGMGTHKELLESCGVYREICLSQLSEEEAKEA